MRRLALLLVSLLAVLAGDAHGHRSPTAPTAVAARGADAPCGGEKIAPDQVVQGFFPSSLQGSYVMVPFTVPAGTTAVRVKYCFDQPDAPTSAQVKHTLDLGLYGPRGGDELWGEREFRGWGGSSHPDVTVSAEGFSTEEQYKAKPKGHVPGRTTRGFRPGAIEPGRWAVELGAAAIASQALGDSDGGVAWRVELEFAEDPAFADEPYRPARYDAAPRAGAGWYVGDLHVHAEHSALGDATMTETFDYAFNSAKLDFVLLSDYVTDAAWGEIGRYQDRHPGKLLGRSSEVITYRGHLGNHVSNRYVDHRTGPVLELGPGGDLELRRPARPPRELLADVRAAGGVTQINHPTIFPSTVPLFALLCRGCPWDYSADETDYSLVDAIEVATGPSGARDAGGLGPNPFTPPAIDFYERALGGGAKIAAVGASDSHHAGRTPGGVAQAPIGVASTVVHAPELSEAGIACGIRAGRTYAKVTGPGAPDVRLEATAGGRTAMLGDTLRGRDAVLKASVLGGSTDMQVQVVRDGVVVRAEPLSGPRHVVELAAGPGRWRLQVNRGSTIEVVSSPVYIEDAAEAVVMTRGCATLAAAGTPGRPRMRVRVLRGRRVRCAYPRATSCSVTARSGGATLARALVRVGRRGSGTRELELTRAGRRALRQRARRRVTLRAVARDRRTVLARMSRTATLRR